MGDVDNFETKIPMEWLEVLLDLGVKIGFDPTSSLEMEEWCCRLIEHAVPQDITTIRNAIESAFKRVRLKPNWIQNPQWPVGPNGPMIFIGQIDCPKSAELFHDDASFYAFFDPTTGERHTVLQVA
jgi:hypothetical protein